MQLSLSNSPHTPCPVYCHKCPDRRQFSDVIWVILFAQWGTVPPTTTDTFLVLVSPVRSPPETWLNPSNEVRSAWSKASISSQQDNKQEKEKKRSGWTYNIKERERRGKKENSWERKFKCMAKWQAETFCCLWNITEPYLKVKGTARRAWKQKKKKERKEQGQ